MLRVRCGWARPGVFGILLNGRISYFRLLMGVLLLGVHDGTVMVVSATKGIMAAVRACSDSVRRINPKPVSPVRGADVSSKLE